MKSRKPHTKLTPRAYEVLAEGAAKGLTHVQIARQLHAELGLAVDDSTVTRALGRIRKARATKRAGNVATVTPIALAKPELSDLEADLEILRRLRARWADLALHAELPLPELAKASTELRGVLSDIRKALGITDEPAQATTAVEDEAARLVGRLDDMAAAIAAGKELAS